MNGVLFKRYGIGAVFIILSIVFIYFGIKNAGKAEDYEPYYTTVNAVITELYPSPAEEFESFAEVMYTDLSGIERSGRIEYSGTANIGDTIQIDMSTHNPKIIGFANAEAEQRQNTEISKNKRYAAIEITAGILMLALGIFLVVLHEKRRRASVNSANEVAALRAETIKSVNVPKAAEPVKAPEAAKPIYDINKMLKEIDEKVPPKPMIKLTPKRAENLSVFESKLGGIPYMPADFEYPKGKSGIFEGRPLRLLAQLNFEKLPYIENFPMKGILQFFCSDDEEECAYGLDFDDPISQNGFRVIYHENIITDESRLMPKESMPTFTDNLGNFPFKGEFLLEAGAVEMCPVTYDDHRFFEEIFKYLSKISGKNITNFNEAENVGFGDDFWQNVSDERDMEQTNTCIGGYPFFTQGDRRSYKTEIADYNVLLFQCDSSYEDNSADEIMWGDMGVANFFIKEEDLKNLDFSKVVYNWDCG